MSVQLVDPATRAPLHIKGDDLTDDNGNIFPFSKGAFRFVKDDNYTANFGFQWNHFEKTQIDRAKQNVNQSYDRFFAVTGWDKQDLAGQNILEVGSGAGRFTEVVLKHTHANLYSVDYSNAVEANFRNNGPNSRLHLFQASIYELPFAPAQFDKVFCFGVLQHTPDFRKSVKCLVDMVKPGGELFVDFYPVNGWYTKIHAKYLLRPFTRRMRHDKLLALIERNANTLIRASAFFEKIGLGRIVNRFLPVCDIKTTIPQGLDATALREWVILDTFDMFSPEHDHPQKLKTVKKWFEEIGMKSVKAELLRYGNNAVNFVTGIK